MPRISSIAGHESSSSSPRCVIRHYSIYTGILLTITHTLKVVSFLAGFITESQKLTFAIFGGTLTTALLVCILKLNLLLLLTICVLLTDAFGV